MKRIALLQDLSGFGKCSLTAAIPVISAMGLQACPLPTAILSAQTGFSSYFYDDYTDRMNQIADEWAKMDVHFEGITSGYLGSPAQIKNVLHFLELFHTNETIYLADPVMGDQGKVIKIFTQEMLDTMKELTRYAQVMTPNLTELCLLGDVSYESLDAHRNDADYLERVGEVAGKLLDRAACEQTIITTGIFRQKEHRTFVGNLIVSRTESSYQESLYTGKGFSGTGDLFASVVIGSLVCGEQPEHAVKRAINFLQPAIEEATEKNIPGNHGIYFEKYLSGLMTNKERKR